MSKKLRIDGYKVVIGVQCYQRFGRQLTPEECRREADGIVRSVKRHLSHYHDTGDLGVECDSEDVCEFCGGKWTENNPDYNGCCEKDRQAEIHRARDEFADGQTDEAQFRARLVNASCDETEIINAFLNAKDIQTKAVSQTEPTP